MKILVSIITPFFNGERFLGAVILSVIQQAYPQWELILVNDGIGDPSESISKSFTDPRIRFNQENQCTKIPYAH